MKKNLSKLFAMALALIMVMALTVPAMAASITIDPNLPAGTTDGNETYTAYKIFDADYAGTVTDSADNTGEDIDDAQDQFGNISYTYTKTGEDDELYNAIVAFQADGKNVFTLTQINNSNKYTVKVNEGVTYDAADLAAALADKVTSGTTGSYNVDGNYVIDGLAEGYYIIKSTLGSKMVVATLGDITINTKNDYPTLTKQVKSEVTTTYGDSATADYGDTITFQITVTIPATAKGAITVHDKLDGDMTYAGMTPVTGITVTATPTDDCTKEFVLDADYVETNKGTSVSFEYTATLNGNVLTATAHPNTAYLTYAGYTSLEDTVNVYTYQMDVFKYTTNTEGEEVGLAGAGFVLQNNNEDSENYGKYYAKDEETGVVTWVNSINDATELSTTDAVGVEGEDGYQAAVYTVVFDGLASGSYTLIENTIPTGYNPAQDTTWEITTSNLTGSTQVEVLNETGTVLPSTGGMGTTLFYTIGGLLVVCAGVLLVTKKRMNNMEG